MSQKLPSFSPQLVSLIAQGEVLPFVGSGVSLGITPSLFPNWKTLLGLLAGRLPPAKAGKANLIRSLAAENEFMTAAEMALDHLGRGQFHDVMTETFGKDRPADVDLSLPQAVWALKAPRVVTTNYDRVLKWAHEPSWEVLNTEPTKLGRLTKATPDKPAVWHLHGHVDHPDSGLILAPKDYDALYRDAATVEKHEYAAAIFRLRDLISRHPLLFIGFGLQDAYVMQAIKNVMEIFKRVLHPSYALLKKGELDAEHVRKEFNIEVIEFDEYSDLTVLLKALAEQAELKRHAAGNNHDIGPAIVPAAYQEWLRSICDDVTPLGSHPSEGQSVCLQQVYVPLLTTRRFQDELQQQLQSGTKSKKQSKRKAAPEPMLEREDAGPQLLLSALGERSLYVSGAAGSGKTTFCRWVAWWAATGNGVNFVVPAPKEFDEKLPESLRGRLPVLIELRYFRQYLPCSKGQAVLTVAQMEDALQRWIAATAEKRGLTWKDFVAHRHHGKLLVIWDGVDEVPETEGEQDSLWYPRESLLSGIIAVMEAWSKNGNRMLLTSRPYGLNPDQVRRVERAGLPEAALAPLPDDLQDLLAERFFKALPKHRADEHIARQLLEQVRRLSQDVAALVSNPLLLTAICIIRSNGKQLPQHKHDLYDRVIETALQARYYNAAADVENVRLLLAAIALGMHTGEFAGTLRAAPEPRATYDELDRILAKEKRLAFETVDDQAAVRDVRDELLGRSGLLSQQESGAARFYHFSFQEFLAAERINQKHYDEQAQLDFVFERAQQRGWRLTLSFLFARRAALLKEVAAATFLGKLLEEIERRRVVAWDSIPSRSDLPAARSSNGLAEAVRPLTPSPRYSGERVGVRGSAAVESALPLNPSPPAPLPGVPGRGEQEGTSRSSAALPYDGLTLVACDALQIMLHHGWDSPKEQQQFVTLALALIEREELELKDRLEVALLLGHVGDPRVPDDIRDPAAWVTVPAGTYFYGDKKQPYQIEQPFEISKYPVTNAQYRRFLERGPNGEPSGFETEANWHPLGWQWCQKENIVEPARWRDSCFNAQTQPVVGISWWEADAFCRWAGYRLPHEREWEAAARGPEGWKYPWGDAWEAGRCNGGDSSFDRTSPVGMFPRGVSDCGAYDMAGNVWTWCANHYSEEATEDDSNAGRVLRGGSWGSHVDFCRSAYRDLNLPYDRFFIIGLCVART